MHNPQLYLIAFLIGSSATWAFDQNPPPSSASHLRGTIRDEEGTPLAGIVVQIKGLALGTYTDSAGAYALSLPYHGPCEVLFTSIGHEDQTRALHLRLDQTTTLDIILQAAVFDMGETVVESQSQASQLRQKGFSVAVLESKGQKTLKADINQVLKTTPGIHLREMGGLGSGFKLSLNGLSGNQIRYFIDGIPLENFGSSLSLNNYPLNLIDRLEVYKGVVPISLGADALGGAINIVTDYRQQSFLDASLSSGSFGTQRLSLNGQFADAPRRIYFKAAAFFNRANNNYWMEEVPLHDLELGNNLGAIRTRRFHDDYTSQMLHAEIGLFERPYADRLAWNITAAGNEKRYQHPDNNIKRIFGHFNTHNSTLLSSLTHAKQLGALQLKAFVAAGRIRESVADTGRSRYNWAGDSVERPPGDPKGELLLRRSLLRVKDQVLRSHLGAEYALNPQHTLSLSATQSYLRRTGEDAVDPFNRSYESPNSIHKNLLGLSYSFGNAAETFALSTFAKQYWYSGRIVTQDYDDSDILTEPSLSQSGYGFALSYYLNEHTQLKSSFETAYRIPEPFESLGDGIYVTANPLLEPEKSHNLNIGTRFHRRVALFKIAAESNLFYRFSKDFIRFNPLGPFGVYENLTDVLTRGIEGSLDLNYRDFTSLHANFTFQDLTDRTRFDEGLPNANYKSRIPNVPHFFANARLGLSPSPPTAANKIHLYWNIRYIREFFLIWEKLGNRADKNIIPTQFTHALETEYALYDGRYHIAVVIDNLTDARVYDHFNIQKPGRSVQFTVRYALR